VAIQELAERFDLTVNQFKALLATVVT
jgi:hypothetical protein